MGEDCSLDLDRLWDEVVGYFGEDSRRIDHTRRVLAFARQILEHETADRTVVEAAAMLHDIGIPEAERKHGSAAGPYQELEGPPVAREILERLGADAPLVEEVARMIASHHSPGEVETPEFDVLWDADWLVNLPEEHPEMGAAEPDRLIERIFHTESGRTLARKMFGESAPSA